MCSVPFKRLAMMFNVVAPALAITLFPNLLKAQEAPQAPPLQDLIVRDSKQFAAWAVELYGKTPWTDRVAWGALGAAGLLALLTIFERAWSLRNRRVLPRKFISRLEDRLEGGRLDRSKLTDLCEMHNCSAARVAGAVASRWGRPTADLERALNLAVRVESEDLMRNIPTLRRVAVLAPMLGLLGSLMMIGRLLQTHDAQLVEETWTSILAQGLLPLTGGVLIAVLSLISYDGLSIKVAKYTSRLEKLGSRLLDQIAIATPPPEPRRMLEPPALPRPHMADFQPRPEKKKAYADADNDDDEDYEPRRRSSSGRRRRKPSDPIDLDDMD
ncbi:MAG: MotA/TolQ/ExbB proton channel family protein [bacterium]